MSFTRCTLCNGKKRIMGLGMIEKECPECKGVGYINLVEKAPVKRVRKKKEIVVEEG